MNTKKKKRIAWNKGLSKATNASVAKIAETMRRRKINNFKAWQNRMKASGLIKSAYHGFAKNGDLAELIGVVLGDGHLEDFPRTERLTISSHSDNHGFIKRYAFLMRKVIGKSPKIKKQKSRCVKIYIYEGHLSRRLAIPVGNRGKLIWKTPTWIFKSNNYLLRYLRGLYEAEGNFAVHKTSGTYKMFFCNTNQSLLRAVFQALPRIGIDSAHLEKRRVTVSRKKDVFRLKNLLKYREY